MSRAAGGWTSTALLRELATRFRRGWSLLPAAARRRWLRSMGIGVPLIALLMALVESLGKRLDANGFLGREADVLRRIEADLPLSFSSAVWIQTLGTDITLILVVAITAAIAVWIARPLEALGIVAAYALLDPIIRLGWEMWQRPRPAVILEGIASPDFASFPSGHTAKALAVYGFLTYLWARAARAPAERLLASVLAALLVLVVGVGRLRMGVHWPSDIVAGAAIGAAWLVILIAALRRAEAGR